MQQYSGDPGGREVKEEAPLLMLNVKAVMAPRKPSIREGRSFMVVSGCVC